jgi:hypothetical protein
MPRLGGRREKRAHLSYGRREGSVPGDGVGAAAMFERPPAFRTPRQAFSQKNALVQGYPQFGG